MHKQYVVLAALLFVSFGFTSAFAENSILSNAPSELDVLTAPSLVNRPFSLEQIQVSSPFDSFLEELEDGLYDEDDSVMIHIRTLIGKGQNFPPYS